MLRQETTMVQPVREGATRWNQQWCKDRLGGFDRLDDCQHGQDCREKLSHRYTLKNKKNKKVNNIIWLLLIFCMEFCL
jgi:hypothetical protein